MAFSLSNEVNPATGLRKGTFGFGTFDTGGKPFPAVVKADGQVLDVSAEFIDTHVILDDWERSFDRLNTIAQTGSSDLLYQDVHPLPPVKYPNLLCAGANYKQHVAEMLTHNDYNQHNRLPGESDEDFFKRNYARQVQRAKTGAPYVWASLHSALMGANDDLMLPLVGKQHDWELELGVVIGKTQRYVTAEEADDLIAGYTIMNDVGSVDLARRTDVHFEFDFISKHQPGFKVCGPFIVPKQFFKFSDDVKIHLQVNGADKQNWPVTDMIFSPQQFVSYLSERVKLVPGDIIATGSPPGNGRSHGHFLAGGDVMESEISFLGRQVNHCFVEDSGGRSPIFDVLIAQG